MVYSTPREPETPSAARRRQSELHGAYHAALATLAPAHRQAVQGYVAAVRDEAAARRVSARDGSVR